MQAIVKHNIENIKEILKKYKVESAYLFGSSLTQKFNKDSDIDILFSFPADLDYEEYANNYFSLIAELEFLLKTKVDLVSEKTIKNPYLIASINENKMKLL